MHDPGFIWWLTIIIIVRTDMQTTHTKVDWSLPVLRYKLRATWKRADTTRMKRKRLLHFTPFSRAPQPQA